MKIILFLAIVSSTIYLTKGISCIECTNARSHSECDRQRRITQCQASENACMIERRVNNGRELITKRCKQPNACMNNQRNTGQCSGPNSVCYCCCNTERCNLGSSSCRSSNRPLTSTNGALRRVSQNSASSKALRDTSRICRKRLYQPKNGILRCTYGFNVGSRCTYSCRGNYVVSGEGSATLECLERGIWSGPHKYCRPLRCWPQRSNVFGAVTYCTRSNFVGSVCSVRCKQRQIGTSNSEVQSFCRIDQSDKRRGRWSSPLPNCRNPIPTKCPVLESFQHVGFTCSNSTEVGSVCQPKCEPGFKLRATGNMTCSPDSQSIPTWSGLAPECIERTCPVMSSTEHVTMECSNQNKVDSTCQFNCLGDLILVGHYHSTCTIEDGELYWSNKFPKCIEIKCPIITPTSNQFIKCSNDFYLSSICEFSCMTGYSVVGSDTLSCFLDDENKPQWSSEPSTCQDLRCPDIEGENLIFECSHNNHLHSTCFFYCPPSHVMAEHSLISCVLLDSVVQWSKSVPTCTVRTCDEFQEVENAVHECSSGFDLSSICQFSCLDGFAMRGRDKVTCENFEGGQAWSGNFPQCIEKACPELEQLPRRHVHCTNGQSVGSECFFKCDDTFTPYPDDSEVLKCQPDHRWDKTEPCCGKPCPESPVIDLVIALDSSSSVTTKGWILMIEFVQNMLSFYDFSSNGTRASLFRYNRKVDQGSKIGFEVAENHGKEYLIKVIGKIPYDGQGTKTGNAISFAQAEMFSRGNRENATDVFILLTDGRSQDSVEAPAQKMKDSGCQVFVVSINKADSMDLYQLSHIASRPQNLFFVNEGYSSLTQKFARKLALSVCGDRCAP